MDGAGVGLGVGSSVVGNGLGPGVGVCVGLQYLISVMAPFPPNFTSILAAFLSQLGRIAMVVESPLLMVGTSICGMIKLLLSS